MNVFSAEAEVRLPRLVLIGREKLLIEQHRGLYSYETRCIRVRSRDGLIAVSGEKLIISFFGAEDMQIEGHVTGIALEDGDA